MDRKIYDYLRKLKKDKLKFEKKLYFHESRVFFDEKIKKLIEEKGEITNKNTEMLESANMTDNILKTYIAELNAKIFPNTWQTNYGEDNIKMNLSNLSMLSYLQNIKANVFIRDKYKLESDALEIFQKEDKKQEKIIKNQLIQDKIDVEIMENEKYKLSLIKDKFRKKVKETEKYENDLRENKFKYEMAIKTNDRLKEMLNMEIIKYQKLSEKLTQKKEYLNTNKINMNLKNDNNDIYDIKQKFFLDYRSFSDKNFLSIKNTRRNSLKLFENKNKKNKIKINPYLINNYKGYKAPLFFIKKNKTIEQKIKLFNIKNSKPTNAYDFLNIFSKKNKYNSINDFINSFNSLNSTKLSFYSAQDMKSTKVNTLSSNNSIAKSITLNNSNKKNIKRNIKKNIIRTKLYTPIISNNNEMYILRDYLSDLIDEEKKVIKYLKNKKAEEIRSCSQIKNCLSMCIDDLNNEINDNKNKGENKIKNNNVDKENEYLLFILSYIYDNCFFGLNFIENVLPKNKSKNNSSEKKNKKISGNFKKRCFSSTYIKYKNNII